MPDYNLKPFSSILLLMKAITRIMDIYSIIDGFIEPSPQLHGLINDWNGIACICDTHNRILLPALLWCIADICYYASRICLLCIDITKKHLLYWCIQDTFFVVFTMLLQYFCQVLMYPEYILRVLMYPWYPFHVLIYPEYLAMHWCMKDTFLFIDVSYTPFLYTVYTECQTQLPIARNCWLLILVMITFIPLNKVTVHSLYIIIMVLGVSIFNYIYSNKNFQLKLFIRIPKLFSVPKSEQVLSL